MVENKKSGNKIKNKTENRLEHAESGTIVSWLQLFCVCVSFFCTDVLNFYWSWNYFINKKSESWNLTRKSTDKWIFCLFDSWINGVIGTWCGVTLEIINLVFTCLVWIWSFVEFSFFWEYHKHIFTEAQEELFFLTFCVFSILARIAEFIVFELSLCEFVGFKLKTLEILAIFKYLELNLTVSFFWILYWVFVVFTQITTSGKHTNKRFLHGVLTLFGIFKEIVIFKQHIFLRDCHTLLFTVSRKRCVCVFFFRSPVF